MRKAAIRSEGISIYFVVFSFRILADLTQCLSDLLFPFVLKLLFQFIY